MKKILVIISIILMAVISLKEESIIIPDKSIRFRVIASSNTLKDQSDKRKLSKELGSYLTDITKDDDSYAKTLNTLKKEETNIKGFIEDYLDRNNMSNKYTLSIGLNEFPDKVYKGIKYKKGKYESVVVTLGNGDGNNWWCVMYPNLCLIDEDNDNIEYTYLVKEILSDYKM